MRAWCERIAAERTGTTARRFAMAAEVRESAAARRHPCGALHSELHPGRRRVVLATQRARSLCPEHCAVAQATDDECSGHVTTRRSDQVTS